MFHRYDLYVLNSFGQRSEKRNMTCVIFKRLSEAHQACIKRFPFMILRLQPQHLRLLKEEAQKVHPIEACALLFGKTTQREAIVEKVVVASNRLASATKFEMNPEAFAKAYTEAERDGLDFVGFFHSHSAPATPSAVDLKYMKLWGSAIWLILSSEDGNLAAYQIRNDSVRKLATKVAEIVSTS